MEAERGLYTRARHTAAASIFLVSIYAGSNAI